MLPPPKSRKTPKHPNQGRKVFSVEKRKSTHVGDLFEHPHHYACLQDRPLCSSSYTVLCDQPLQDMLWEHKQLTTPFSSLCWNQGLCHGLGFSACPLATLNSTPLEFCCLVHCHLAFDKKSALECSSKDCSFLQRREARCLYFLLAYQRVFPQRASGTSLAHEEPSSDGSRIYWHLQRAKPQVCWKLD